MAFTISKVAEKKERKEAKEIPPIFERAKAQAIKQLDNHTEIHEKDMGSLQQAIYRYETGPANKNAYASYNWKLPQGAKSKIPSRDNPKNIAKGEKVEVRLKAGGVAVKCLKNPETGDIEKMLEVDCENLVATLQDMLQHIKTMTKESDTGLKFHKVAIKTAKPKFASGKKKQIAYCEEADDWTTFSDGTVAEQKVKREEFLAKKNRSNHWANK